MKGQNKRLKRLKEQEDRLHEFDGQEPSDHYEEKRVWKDWWVKSWNGGTERWQVAIYSEKSFRAYKAFSENKSRLDYVLNKDD